MVAPNALAAVRGAADHGARRVSSGGRRAALMSSAAAPPSARRVPSASQVSVVSYPMMSGGGGASDAALPGAAEAMAHAEGSTGGAETEASVTKSVMQLPKARRNASLDYGVRGLRLTAYLHAFRVQCLRAQVAPGETSDRAMRCGPAHAVSCEPWQCR